LLTAHGSFVFHRRGLALGRKGELNFNDGLVLVGLFFILAMLSLF